MRLDREEARSEAMPWRWLGLLAALALAASLIGGVSVLAYDSRPSEVVVKSDTSLLASPSPAQIEALVRQLSPSVVAVLQTTDNSFLGSGLFVGGTDLVVTSLSVAPRAGETYLIRGPNFLYPAQNAATFPAFHLSVLRASSTLPVAPVAPSPLNPAQELGQSAFLLTVPDPGAPPQLLTGTIGQIRSGVLALDTTDGQQFNLPTAVQVDISFGSYTDGAPVFDQNGYLLGIMVGVPTLSFSSQIKPVEVAYLAGANLVAQVISQVLG